MTANQKLWAWIAGLSVAAILVIAVVVRAFVGGPNDMPSSTGTSADGSADDPPPAFAIPKVQGCEAADRALLDQIRPTLRSDLGLASGQQTRAGDSTYIAAIITYGGQPANPEPGLWLLKDDHLYAVGATAGFSNATPAESIGEHGSSSQAARVIACAAGY